MASITTSFNYLSSDYASFLVSSSTSDNTLIRAAKISLNLDNMMTLSDLTILNIVSQAEKRILASLSFIDNKIGFKIYDNSEEA